MSELDPRWRTLYRRHTAPEDTCPSGERLADLAAGRVWPWSRRRLTAHLAACTDCAGDFRVLLEARSGLESALAAHRSASQPATEPRPAPRWRPLLRPLPLAAAAAAMALAIVFAPRPEPQPARQLAGDDLIMANDFEQRFAQNEPDLLFQSGFDTAPDLQPALFKDHFGG